MTAKKQLMDMIVEAFEPGASRQQSVDLGGGLEVHL